MSTPSMAVLIIMDGLALNPSTRGNAVAAARTPVLDRLMAAYPMSRLLTSGRDVGLMDGQMGDSNVGHLNLGAGRIVKQYVLRILDAIDDGSFFENPVLIQAVDGVKARGGALHILGIASPGGVHGHSRIVEAVARLAKARGVERVFVHAFTDGRDVPPTSGLGQIAELEESLTAQGLGRIASVSGRYFAMDRDRRWDRTKKAYDAV
ncbi:MAG: 2,3-bisphosphoglycerate-independent phosphoglycerate mutase, partial [Clostridia bacterium]